MKYIQVCFKYADFFTKSVIFFCKNADFVKNCRDKLDFILMAKEALTYETVLID